MYYRLKQPWAFRGWKKLPYAIRAEYGEKKHSRPFFFDKVTFMELLYLNGQENIELSDFSEKGRKTIQEFLANDVVEQSEYPMDTLEGWQRYCIFPSRYVSSVHWSITGKCNFRCRHCLVSAPDAHHPQLPLSDCLHIIEEIASCGIKRVDITGGEPLVRDDFEEIVKSLSAHGIDIGVVFTNASLLTEEVLTMLERNHQHPSFQLSFDGLGHHDWLRGIPGAEEQADAAFRLLREKNYGVSVAMSLHKENADSLRATANYLAGYGVKTLRVNAPQELGVWKQYADEYALTNEELWAVYKEYIGHFFEDGCPIGIELEGFFSCEKDTVKYKVPYAHHVQGNMDWSKIPYCESVRYNIYIGPEGRLAPCMGFSDTALGEKFPSVLEKPLAELTLNGYYYDVVQTKVSDLLAKNPECASCEQLPVCCGGCMVQDITDDGDFLVPDQRACYFHKNVTEKAVREVADAAIEIKHKREETSYGKRI